MFISFHTVSEHVDRISPSLWHVVTGQIYGHHPSSRAYTFSRYQILLLDNCGACIGVAGGYTMGARVPPGREKNWRNLYL